MQRFLCIALFTVFSSLPLLAQTPRVNLEDLRPLTGDRWVGALVYRDYRSNKETSIPSNLKVTQTAEKSLTWTFEYEYPNEPKANSKENVTLSEDGTSIDDEKIVERENLAGGVLRLVTERRGKDNNQDALIRHTYLIGKSSFSIKKEVRPDGSNEFFERNRYTWRR